MFKIQHFESKQFLVSQFDKEIGKKKLALETDGGAAQSRDDLMWVASKTAKNACCFNAAKVIPGLAKESMYKGGSVVISSFGAGQVLGCVGSKL